MRLKMNYLNSLCTAYLLYFTIFKLFMCIHLYMYPITIKKKNVCLVYTYVYLKINSDYTTSSNIWITRIVLYIFIHLSQLSCNTDD